MAVYTRNNTNKAMLDGSQESRESDGDMTIDDFVSKYTTPAKSPPPKSHLRERQELLAKEKKIRSKLAKNRVKQEAAKEQRRQDFEGDVLEQIEEYQKAKTGTQMDQLEGNLNESLSVLNESQNLLDASDVFDQAPRNDEGYVQQMDAIKSKQAQRDQKEKDAFLAAKRRRDEKRKRKEEKKAMKEKTKDNFKKAQKEHKERKTKRKKEEKEKKEKTKEKKREDDIANSERSLGSTQRSIRRLSRGVSRRISETLGWWFNLTRKSSSKKNEDDDKESIRTRNGMKSPGDVMGLWGVEASSPK